MSTDELLEKLKSLSKPELRAVLQQVGFVPARNPIIVDSKTSTNSTTGLSPGLLRGMVTYMADDFDAELPESFWAGDGDAP